MTRTTTNTTTNNNTRGGNTTATGTTDSSGSPSSAVRLYERLCETQQASLRKALEEKDAAVARLQDNETTVKELVQAMDEAVKSKGKQR